MWSQKIAEDISEWVDWCHRVGAKLLDETISVADVLKHVIIPRGVRERPGLFALGIEWPERFFELNEDGVYVELGGERVPFYEVGFELTGCDPQDPLGFRVFSEEASAEYEIQFGEDSVEYVPVAGLTAEVVIGKRQRSLAEVFQKEAQRSVFWKGNIDRHREEWRQEKHGGSRFERGDLARLLEITRQAPLLTPDVTIHIVQPGVSQKEVTPEQRKLLAATELFLKETYNVPFGVIGGRTK